MTILYSIFIYLFWGTIKFLSFFHPKAKLWIDGRTNWKQKLNQHNFKNNIWVWFHCSSFGEFEDFRELLILYREKYQTKKIILTFSSPSGYVAFKNIDFADLVFYMPLDTKSNARFFLSKIKPQLVVFSRSELWFNFLSVIKERKINSVLVSLSLVEKSSFLKFPQKYLYKKCLKSFTKIYCQNKKTKVLLSKSFGIENTLITGNTRIDRIVKSFNNFQEYNDIEKFINNDFCVIVGSSLEKDEKIILSVIESFKNEPIKWLIVPHEINQTKIDLVINKNPSKFIKYSKLGFNKSNANVMYVDFVGGLKYLYKYANFAVVGGGFNKIGIHNIIEPAIFGLEIAFGPNHRNYQEALDLIDLKGASIFNNTKELIALIENHRKRNNLNLNKRIKNYVISNKGASEKILNDLTKLFK